MFWGGEVLRIDLSIPDVSAVWRQHTIAALYELAKTAPGQSCELALPRETVFVVQDAGLARHVLKENGTNYRKNFGGFSAFFGDSRLTADSPLWEKLQQLSQPFISAARPAEVVAASDRHFTTAAQQLLASRGDHGAIVADRELSRAAARVVSEVALGFETLDIDDQLLADFRTLLELGAAANWNFGGLALEGVEQRRADGDAALARLGLAIGRAAETTIARAREPTLLGELAAAREVDLVSEVCSLLFAGFDTSASALGWGLFLLAATPGLQQHLRSEVRRVCADAAITVEHLANLGDLVAFQEEVLRMFPPIPVLGRTSIAADVFGETRIAAGSRVLISIIGLHHDRRRFEAPWEVRLDRSLPAAERRVDQALPFGAGRRVCGGSRLANVEMTTAYAVLLRALEFNLPDQKPLQFEWSASLRRSGGQRLNIRPAPQ